jgi:mRNA interferase MazF
MTPYGLSASWKPRASAGRRPSERLWSKQPATFVEPGPFVLKSLIWMQTRTTGARCSRLLTSWKACVLRGDIHRLRPLPGRGHEQHGERYGVVVQANELLPRSVVLIAPTSQSARPASFRPELHLSDRPTRVLVEQVGAVDVSRLGELVGHASPEELWGIDEALLTVLGLR